MRKRNLIGVGLIFLLSIAIYISIYYQTIPEGNTPPVQQGVLDLSAWDLHQQGMVNLDGEWEFYDGQLLEPADFVQPRADGSYLSVPGTWKGAIAAGGKSGKGYGTYRLKVMLRDADEIYGLKLRSIRMSHRLYIDGKLEGSSGLPAADRAGSQPGNTPYSTFFHSDAREIEIVLQVANYEYITGGIVNSIQFGLEEDITRQNGIQIGTDVAAILILGMFGAYHLSFFFLRRGESIYLLSGLYLFFLLIAQSLFGEKILLRLFPAIPFELAYKLLDLSLSLSGVVILALFYKVDHRLFSFRKIVVLTAPIALYTLLIALLPYSVYSTVQYLTSAYAAIILLYMIGRMIYLYSRNEQLALDRKEWLFFIGASVSLLVFLLESVLYTENLVQVDLVSKVGVVCFITCMNFLLAVRFTNALQRTEILSHRLKISNQHKDEFLKHTSHEIKKPLHSMMNITAHLLDDEEHNLTEKQTQNLWLIKDTSRKLSMLIQDLIDVTRLKHGELPLRSTIVDVRVVAQLVIDVLRFELLGKPVRLENRVGSNIWVVADENRLHQIMYNLVHNAIKHTDKGTIVVTSNLAAGKVHIAVEDTGSGISSDQHATMFDYFKLLDHPLPWDEYTGRGLGLYISWKLVERMGGEIRIDWTEVGKGTRMTFALPCAERVPASEEPIGLTEERQRAVGDPLPFDILNQHEHTILIVDDEASNIYTLLNILRRNRYNVVTAFSAEEAMVKMKEHPHVDLVILDIIMQGRSGIELCQMLRRLYSILDLPILFATGKETSQDIALGFRVGANDYVTKPFDEETLIARIQTLIAMKTSIQEAIRNEHAFYQAQIKPHFLYNALSSVIAFCYQDGKKAAHLLSMLSQYLRYILDMDRTTLFVPLHQELELIQAYVEIEQARFGERFDFVCHVEESVLNRTIPSLCIQPFVENAIRHGLFEKEGRGRVRLMIHEGDRYLQVIVEDDGVGIPDDVLFQLSRGERPNGGSGGIGIANIRKRIDAILGATLTISSELGRGTKAMICLPIRQEELAEQEGEWGSEVV